MPVQVKLSGAIVRGREKPIIKKMLADAVDTVAAQGKADVMQILDAKIKHPTPYYETQIRVRKLGDDRIVDDRKIVYGPWLEGVGRRNRTTRFKGYRAFRTARAKLERKSGELARWAAVRWIGKL